MVVLRSGEREFRPASEAELARFVRSFEAGKSGESLMPVGGRTALHYGFERDYSSVLFLDLTQLDSVVEYPADDLTITVGAGMRVERLKELLREHGQRVPVDIAQAERATVGGAVATNTCGPRRFGYGSLREWVLGLSAVDGTGRLFKAGGRVVKNAAGYDLCRLLVGSLGTLAVLTRVTLRLTPIPEWNAVVWCVCDHGFEQVEAVVAGLMSETRTRPVTLDVLNAKAAAHLAREMQVDLPVERPVVIVGYEGLEKECQWQVERLQEELKREKVQRLEVLNGEAERLWAAMAEYSTFSDDPLSFQACVRPSAVVELMEAATRAGVAVCAHAGNGVLVGHLPEEIIRVEEAERLLEPLWQRTLAGGGELVILQCEPQWKQSLPVWGKPKQTWPLMRQLKQRFDPHNLLNPGLFVDAANQTDAPWAG